MLFLEFLPTALAANSSRAWPFELVWLWFAWVEALNFFTFCFTSDLGCISGQERIKITKQKCVYIFLGK